MPENEAHNGPEEQSQESTPIVGGSDVPVEAEEPIEPEHPRRAASAEFVIEGEVGSASVLREAMDPANQSLADALRLSYRVLQIVIVILLVLFLFSGFRRVETTETGVQTLFGKIRGGESMEAELQPGLAMSFLPYPAAEFIVFNQNHAVDLTNAFWPNQQLARYNTFEEAAGTVRPSQAFAPGLGPDNDGMLLLVDGIGHTQFRASYRIDDPVDFVNRLSGEGHSQHVVELALKRAMVQVASQMTLSELIDEAEIIAERVQTEAQAMLDQLDVGITVQRVQMINLRPPVAILNSMNSLGTVQETADAARSEARTNRNKMLVAAAGESYQELLELISQYEEAILEAGGETAETESLLRQIDLLMESDTIRGEVSETIAQARAYKETIRATIGAYASRFEALYPSYRANPQFVVSRELLDTYGRVMAGELVEVIYMPRNLGQAVVRGTTSNELMVKKRRESQERRRGEALRATGLTGEYRLRLGEHNINRRLGLDEEGNVVGRGNQ